jgi:hypothetical protein
MSEFTKHRSGRSVPAGVAAVLVILSVGGVAGDARPVPRPSIGLVPGRPVRSMGDAGGQAPSVLWHGWTLRLGRARYPVGDANRWPRIVGSLPDAPEVVIFEATNAESVYWGAPLGVTWLAPPHAPLVRLIELSGLGSPADAACLALELVSGKVRARQVTQPGRDDDCPTWASPVVEASRRPWR